MGFHPRLYHSLIGSWESIRKFCLCDKSHSCPPSDKKRTRHMSAAVQTPRPPPAPRPRTVRSPDSPPMTPVHGCWYAVFHVIKTDKPVTTPNTEKPMATYNRMRPMFALNPGKTERETSGTPVSNDELRPTAPLGSNIALLR